MLIGLIHPGSGIGDQLFSYITTRTIALDKGYDFGFVGKEFFKGKDFMNLDWGKETNLEYHILEPTGKLLFTGKDFRAVLNTFEFDKPYYDPEINFIEDGTVIDGCSAQDERYWGHRLNEIREWLRTEPLEMPDDVCVLNIRGGEYLTVPDLILPFEYWQNGIEKFKSDYPIMRFEIHTDDPVYAKSMFPDLKIIQNIDLNWRSVRYAKHLILSNSAFGILPALLNENVDKVIVPRWWAGFNIKKWERPQNYYRTKKFKYCYPL